MPARVRNAYNLVDSVSPDYERDLQLYPLLADEPIYVLKDIGQDEKDELALPMAKALVVVSAREQAMANPERAAQLGGGAFDLSRIPPGTDLFTVIRQLPAGQRQQIAATIDERFAALGDKMISQTAVGQVRAEYEALGMDMAALQIELHPTHRRRSCCS